MFLAVSCRSGNGGLPTRVNVVLVTVDTLRADRLTPYGYDKIRTPHIAQLANEGVLFEQAFTDVSWTLPALSSVMTGHYPDQHGVRTWRDVLPESATTLAEQLRHEGYRTAAVVGSYPLDRAFGLAQGFEDYDDTMTRAILDGPPPPSNDKTPADFSSDRNRWQIEREATSAYRSDSEVADVAMRWLDEHPQDPFFLWVHFFGPHEKGKRFGMPEEERERHVAKQIQSYDSDVVTMDGAVGKFLDHLRRDTRYSRTAVIFHSDHGQSLREHGIFGHGMDLFDTCVHIPLIVRLPGDHRAGERVGRLVRNLDIHATVLRLAGLQGDGSGPAHDLLATAGPPNNYVYLETFHTRDLFARDVVVDGQRRVVGKVLRGIRTQDWKLVRREPHPSARDDTPDALPEPFVRKRRNDSLYDMRTDPGERRNLAAARRSEREALEGLLDEHTAQSAAESGTGHLDEAAVERLRSLGYLPE